MGNPMNGDIYEGQLRPGDIGLTEKEASYFKELGMKVRLTEFQNRFREQGALASATDAPTRPMPRYKCHKEVWALKIKDIQQAPANQEALHTAGDWVITPEDDGYAPFPVGDDWYVKHNPRVGGYFVVYADGYKSYSPAKAFEEGYSRL